MSDLPPFAVLHVCVGNICRSPMAERLFALAIRRRLGTDADEYVLSHGAGTGSWHVGQGMNPPAARQVIARGGDVSGFRARQLATSLIDMSDLVLCATAAQSAAVTSARPDAAARTFVLGEFGRLLPFVDLAGLPGAAGATATTGPMTARAFHARAVALVAAVDAARGGVPPLRKDDLDDPWGLPDQEFARVADEIEQTVDALAEALVGRGSFRP